MIKQLLLAATVAAEITVCAQEATTIPSLNEMPGEFVVLNYQGYDGTSSLSSTKVFNISLSGDNLINIEGFYMNNAPDFHAEYDETTGTISIEAGTAIFGTEGYMYYLYPYNLETEEIIYRPIEYKYIGANTWECNVPLLLTAMQGDETQSYIFSTTSRMSRCNATSNNVSYVGSAGNQTEYIESRSSYVTIVGNNIRIFNILQADQYGYGVNLQGTFDPEDGDLWLEYTLTGYSNDGTYRILTGCEYDESTNMPTGVAHTESNYAKIHGTIDLENGEISLEPMAIWVAELNTSTGQIYINENLLFEFIKSVNVTYDVEKTDVSAVETPTMTDVEKEISHIDYYTIDGRKIAEPQNGCIIIKVTVYKDNTKKTEKIIFK